MFDNIDDLEHYFRFLDILDNSEFDSDLSDEGLFSIFNDEQIRETFRFGKEPILYITGLVSNKIQIRYSVAKHRLTDLDQVLAALQSHATGTFQLVVGNYHVFFITYLIAIKHEFYNIAKMHGCVGCLDGTHLRISRPYLHEAVYVNPSRTIPSLHKLFVMQIADFSASMSANREGSMTPLYSGYGCTPFILTPYNDPTNEDKERLKKFHKATRCTVERAFGTLKRRFHCLHTELRYQPRKVCRIAMACFVLHNITKARYKPEFKDDVIILEAEMVQIVRPTAEASIASQSAREESRTRSHSYTEHQCDGCKKIITYPNRCCFTCKKDLCSKCDFETHYKLVLHNRDICVNGEDARFLRPSKFLFNKGTVTMKSNLASLWKVVSRASYIPSPFRQEDIGPSNFPPSMSFALLLLLRHVA
ncbi:Uncharacterized protein APZ42_031356 [Daphnia magna]|uniref:DDE Tnp4 domain-containing protein n=1 Tax=Daphnia magna TaxID=35525 RepID=A0A164MX57_9CRUS|nr:Uncharacterized protein APZ42_031356 [Daphnia magna]